MKQLHSNAQLISILFLRFQTFLAQTPFNPIVNLLSITLAPSRSPPTKPHKVKLVSDDDDKS